MIRIEGLENLPAPLPASVVTIGKFFTVHLGHQALIRAAVESGADRGVPSVVLTFDRHPQEVLQPGTVFREIASLDERLALIAALGADYAIVVRLDPTFLNQPAEEFARRVLADRLGAGEVVASENFRFGHGAAGTPETLQALGHELGFTTRIVPPVLFEGEPVSSSRIATAIAAGQVDAAAAMLARPYRVVGDVVTGDQRGRELGFPTANVRVSPQRLLPADGVYGGSVEWEHDGPSRRQAAVINLGVRPTVDGRRHLLEAHLLDFEGNLYGRCVRVAFKHRLRDEQRFASLDGLKEQIGKDVVAARRMLGG
jgi:riboflavin kinase/FMN adenylyltransferase